MKKIFIIMMMICLFAALPISVNATSITNLTDTARQIKIDKKSLDVTNNDIKEYNKYADGLIKKLRNTKEADHSKIIKDYSNTGTCEVRESAENLESVN